MNQSEQLVNEARLDALLAEVVHRRDSGEQVDVESICAAHPELADSLRSYFRGEELFKKMAADGEPSHDENVAPQAQETVRPGAAHRTDLDLARPFGRYQIIRQLGEGAMGAVYLAENQNLGRQVALKLPKLQGVEGGEFLQRFYREARAAAALKHPNLCQVYDADEVNGTPYIAMEYLDGQPLSRFVGSEEFLDQRRIATALREVALGLAHAHQAGVLHRDLKPGNVIIRVDGSAYVTDFGLARKVDSTDESRITVEGTILGTPAYMSPEQIEGKPEKIGPPADVYSLGVMFYELLTGQLPFRGSLRGIINQALNKSPERPSKLRPGIDSTLEDLCLNLLEKEAARRPSTMQAVADQLEQWLHRTSTEEVARRHKSDSNRDKLDGMKGKILDLAHRGQFAAAVAGLEKMAAITIADAEEYVAWAKQKLPEIKAMPQTLRENAPMLVATATQLVKEHDYAQAAELLTQIPPDFRSEVAQQLLEEAMELQDESDLLLLDIKECVRKKKYEGVEENLKRFLELKPGNRFARQLQESLKTYSKVPSRQRNYKYDNKGILLPDVSDNIWRGWLGWSVLVGLIVFGVAYNYITIYLKSGDRTLAVQIDKDWLEQQGGNLGLSVDGKEHAITAGDMEVKVTFGDHGFSVKNGDTVVHNPQTFSIEKAARQVLRIDASGMSLAAVGSTPASLPHPANEVKLVQLDDSHEVHRLVGPAYPILELHAVNNVLYATDHERIFRYNLIDGSELPRIDPGPRNNGIAVSSDGRKIAVTKSATVEFWNTETLKVDSTVPIGRSDGFLWRLAATPDLETVIATFVGKAPAGSWGPEYAYVIRRKSNTVSQIAEYGGAVNGWGAVEYAPDQSCFYYSCGQGEGEQPVYRIDAASLKVTSGKATGQGGNGEMAPLIGTRLVAVSSWSGNTRLLDTESWKTVGQIPWHDDHCDGKVCTSPDGKRIATADVSDTKANHIVIRRTSDYLPLFEINLGRMKINDMTFTADSQHIAFAGDATKKEGAATAYTIRVWRLPVSETGPATVPAPPDSGAPPASAPIVIDAPRTPLPDGPAGLVKSLNGHKGVVAQVAWSPDGRTLASVSDTDGTLRVWDVETGGERHQSKCFLGYALAIHPDGKLVATSSPHEPVGHAMTIYNMETGKKVAETPQVAKTILSAMFSADGQYFAIHCRDGAGIHVYDVSKLPDVRVAAELPGGDSGWVVSLAFLPNSQQLLAGSSGEKYGLRLFDVAAQREIRSYRERNGTICSNIMGSIAVHPSGKQFHVFSNSSYRLTELNVLNDTAVRALGKDIREVVYSPSGEVLVGVSHKESGENAVFANWAQKGLTAWKKEVTDLDPLGLAISPDGRFIAIHGRIIDTKDELQRETLCPIQIWRLPKEVWPTLKSEAATKATTPLNLTPGLIGLQGLTLSGGTKFTGTYKQQSPVATHDIVVTLKELKGNVWHGEFESLQATPAAGGGPTKTGFKFSCELTVTSPTSAQLKMTAITGNDSGNPIRDTTSNWVEYLKWDGKALSSGAMTLSLVAPVAAEPKTVAVAASPPKAAPKTAPVTEKPDFVLGNRGVKIVQHRLKGETYVVNCPRGRPWGGSIVVDLLAGARESNSTVFLCKGKSTSIGGFWLRVAEEKGDIHVYVDRQRRLNIVETSRPHFSKPSTEVQHYTSEPLAKGPFAEFGVILDKRRIEVFIDRKLAGEPYTPTQDMWTHIAGFLTLGPGTSTFSDFMFGRIVASE